MSYLSESLNLYEFFVNQVFGDVILAAVGIAALFFLMGTIFRLSYWTTAMIVIIFLAGFTFLAINPLILFLVWIVYGLAFFVGLKKFLDERQ